MLDFLEQEQISKELLEGIREYRNAYPTPPELQNRIPKPRYHYYGKEVWEASIAALLCGENLLLAGSKATGKNVLAENLAQVFARPSWDVSFHVNMDAASLIGMDTMNYGYAGTRELNEALTSRFAVIQMPAIDGDGLDRLLGEEFPSLEKKYRGQFVQLFLDLQKKCESAEISSKALDLRGMLDALRLIRRGISAGMALDMGITNKAFDSYEQGLIRDVIAARIPAKLDRSRLFTD